MKVLFVSGEFPPMQGGVGDYTYEIGQALAEQGCQVHIVTSKQASPAPGLTVHPVIPDWKWGCWRILLDLIALERPDLVHIQYQAAAYGMHPAINFFARRLRWTGPARPRVALTFHDLKVPYLFPKAGPLRRRVIDELARSSDAAITTNQEDFQDLRRRLGPGGPPVSLIPIGSNISPQLPGDYDREAWRARWSVAPGDLLLCFFGFVNDRKGVDTLLQALHLLATEQPAVSNPRLLMIGGQTGASDPTNVAYLAGIQDLIGRLGLGDRVLWTGYVPAQEVSASFAAADLCVLPYRDGVSFLHGTFHAALAHGVPILTTRPRLPLAELVAGENVWLVPPEQPQALVEAILHLAAAPELRRALGQGARRLSGHFAWEAIAAATLKLYREIGAGG